MRGSIMSIHLPQDDVYERTGDRMLVLLTSGNLAISQAVTNLLQEGNHSAEGPCLMNAPTMFEAARVVGDALREVAPPRCGTSERPRHRLQRIVYSGRADCRRVAAPFQYLCRGKLH